MFRWLDWYVAKAPQPLANRVAAFANTVTKANDITSKNLAETQATAVVRGLLFRRVARRRARAKKWGLTSDRHAGARIGNGPGVCFSKTVHRSTIRYLYLAASDPLPVGTVLAIVIEDQRYRRSARCHWSGLSVAGASVLQPLCSRDLMPGWIDMQRGARILPRQGTVAAKLTEGAGSDQLAPPSR